MKNLLKSLRKAVVLIVTVLACSTTLAGVRYRYHVNPRQRTTVVVTKHQLRNRPNVVTTKRVEKRHYGPRHTTVILTKRKRMLGRY